MPSRFLARQLSRPSGQIGRFILGPIWNRRNAALNDAAFGGLDLQPTDRVLEVGFGGGHLLARMAATIPGGQVVGVDASQAMVAYCTRRYQALLEEGKLSLKCGRAEALPFPDAAFTKACSVNSIFYWEDAPRAFAELWRVLTAPGRLVMCLTDRRSLETRRFAQEGLSLFTIDEVRQMLEAAGFGVDRATPRSDKHRDFWCVVARK